MNLVLIGDEGIDRFHYGRCDRMCPEAPVPIFKPIWLEENDGMAGNVFKNLVSLTYSNDIVKLTNKVKPIKTRYIDEVSNQMLLRTDEYDKIEESLSDIDIVDLKDIISGVDAVILSDYNKGFLSEKEIEIVAKICDDFGIPTFLDTKKAIGDWARNISFIKLNNKEYLLNEGNFSNYKNQLIVTLGSEGAIHYNRHMNTFKKYKLDRKYNVRDVSGAGDTFLAAFAVKYVETKDVAESIIFANKCSSWVVTQKGVVPVNLSKV